jgi:hypothetical protein
MSKKDIAVISVFLLGYAVLIAIFRGSDIDIHNKLLVISGYMVLYLSVIYGEMAYFRGHFGKAGDWIRTLSSVGRAAKKNEAYPAMGNALNYVSEYAYLTYFNNRGPSESHNRAEINYHTQLREAVQSRPQTVFRRIIGLSLEQDTQDKRKWVGEEMVLANNHDNYAIRFIVAGGDNEIFPYNVQIFDNFVFIIDPSRTNEDTLPRDMHLLSAEMAGIWFRYYRQIWDRHTVAQPPEGYLQEPSAIS